MYNFPDLTPIFILAFIGLIAAVIAIVGGCWWLFEHVRFV